MNGSLSGKRRKGQEKRTTLPFQIANDLSFFSHSTIKCCFSLSPMFLRSLKTAVQQPKAKRNSTILAQYKFKVYDSLHLSDFIAPAIPCRSLLSHTVPFCYIFTDWPGNFHKNYIVRINLYSVSLNSSSQA